MHGTQDYPTLAMGALISGGGRTLVNFVECIARGDLNAKIPVVIASRSTVKGVERAREVGLPVEIVRVRDFPDVDAFSQRIVAILERYDVQLACQCGWTCYWRIPDHWYGRVLNIHPALLPKFGGKGYYGHHVHEAVLAAGEKLSGCSVHFANNDYDAGPIAMQRTVPVLPHDTPDMLAARVFEQECIAYPAAVRLYAKGHLHIDGQRVMLCKPGGKPRPVRLFNQTA